MAWMRMMGADSVTYHRETVLGRADDHPGQALAYYASRGETPLMWGGAGARSLGLVRNVTDAQYETLFGPGGAVDPTIGERLVTTRRPGMELVIAAHKSVAELGVIGRAEDMHRILDAEHVATMAYLDDLVRERGGRRGSASVATPTAGQTYAVTRHATSRAGDPSPHDHVLIANLLRMDDDRGGWKAADMSLVRDHLHAATMDGRMAAAREAVRLGYGIEADDGPSGRLGQWAIAGVPETAMEVHSKRAAEITAETQRRGFDSYRARGIVARDNRAPKGHQPVADLMARWHTELGTHMTLGQRAAALAVTTSGRGTELIVGVAGAGKTTALAAVRQAFEADGFEVIGTSTSGQAARTLTRQAGIEASRTLASLIWRLEHGQLALSDRHVVVLDEAAMSADAGLLQVLSAASRAGAKVLLVGDHRQLGAVGPGGGFESLVARYGAAVHVLDENVRQRDVAERAALAELRDGEIAKGVASYARRGRIVAAPDRASAVEAVVAGWAADVAQGHETMMYAYRRADVAMLNEVGQQGLAVARPTRRRGVLAPGGTPYAVGDRVVALAPAAGGTVVTSETGTVVALDAKRNALVVRMDDGGDLRRLEAEEIADDRMAHAYAVTVHRSQGSTVQRAHALEDGGGRELAYVKMSRARERSTVYVVADDVDQAREDLAREWSAERRPAWAIDSGAPVTDPAAVEASIHVAKPMRDALRRGRLTAERAAIAAVIPPDPTAEMQVGRIQREIDRSDATRKDRRRLRGKLANAQGHGIAAGRELAALTAPELAQLDAEEERLSGHLAQLQGQAPEYGRWVLRHPEAARRIDQLGTEIEALDERLRCGRDAPDRAVGLDRHGPWRGPAVVQERDFGIDL